MQTKKLFNPALVGRTFVSPYIPQVVWQEMEHSPRWWESEAEARKYARSLGEGLTIWSTIDIIVALALVSVSFFVTVPLAAILFFATLGVGGPLIMMIGIGYGCLRHLTIRQTWAVVREYFLEPHQQ